MNNRKYHFINLIGPDGVGKSTVANTLAQKAVDSDQYSNATVLHHRFDILPALSNIPLLKTATAIRSKFKTRSPSSTNTVEPQFVGEQTKRHSWLRTLGYMSYYSLDFYLGEKIVTQARAQNTLLIADRYFFDFYIQRHYLNLPMVIKDQFLYAIPKPDEVYFLKATPSIIYKRKMELSETETKLQNQRCESLIQRLGGCIIDADKNADQVVNSIWKNISVLK